VYYHVLEEKAELWRVDLVDIVVEGVSRGKVLGVLREVLGQGSGSRFPSGQCGNLPGNLSFRFSDSGLLRVHASGLVASASWFRDLFASLPAYEWRVRRVDWCVDVAASSEVVGSLRCACTSYVCDNEGGLTCYFGKVSRANRRFTRVYLWQVPEGGDVLYLRIEHCVRPVSYSESQAVSRAFASGAVVGGVIGRSGRRAEAVIAGCGVSLPAKRCVSQLDVERGAVRSRAIVFHLKRVRGELLFLRGVSGVGTLLWYTDRLIEVYASRKLEVVQ
jgi:hypothetical protein